MADILVVEDDREMNRLLCSILEGNHYRCFSEYTGNSDLGRFGRM